MMSFFKLIGKDLLLLAAFRAGADERFQMFMALKPRTMLRCCHHVLLSSILDETPSIMAWPTTSTHNQPATGCLGFAQK